MADFSQLSRAEPSRDDDDGHDILVAEVVSRDGLKCKYLRPQDLRKLSHTEFTSRRLIEGLYSGRHQTMQRGQSIEFRDYRQYIPGDDVQHLDWKVYGRTDKLFIKRFEHHADWTVHLMIDASRSMSFRGFDNQGDSKFDAACRLAAAIAFLITKQHDRFSFSLARDGLHQYTPPSGTMSFLVQILHDMEEVQVRSEADLAEAIRALMPHAKRRDLLCLFSDLLDDPSDLLKQIRVWMQRGGEVILFHILHHDEIELPDLGPLTLIDSEQQVQLKTDLSSVRQDYGERMEQFLSNWSKQSGRLGIDYNLVRVRDEYTRVLEKYFARRRDRLAASGGFNASRGSSTASI